jgi:NADH dehydrogenase (ubiquinone) flavoprotein 2
MLRLVRGIRRFSSGLSVHRDAPYNNLDTPFDFTEENYKEIKHVLTKYPSQYKKSAVIPLLYIAQKQCDNWIPLSAMNKISKILEITEMDVYEVASFYSMFNRTPVGKYHLQVCGTTPCMVRGAREIIETIEEECGIHLGQTSRDGLFTLSEVECLGACVNAPMMQVNNEKVYEDLTPDSIKNVLEKFRNGEEVKVGPQNSRKNSEGVLGRTTLKSIPEPPAVRDFAKAKEEYEKLLKAREEDLKKQAAAKK